MNESACTGIGRFLEPHVASDDDVISVTAHLPCFTVGPSGVAVGGLAAGQTVQRVTRGSFEQSFVRTLLLGPRGQPRDQLADFLQVPCEGRTLSTNLVPRARSPVKGGCAVNRTFFTWAGALLRRGDRWRRKVDVRWLSDTQTCSRWKQEVKSEFTLKH